MEEHTLEIQDHEETYSRVPQHIQIPVGLVHNF